jgi:hypothetical protein
MRRTAAAPTEAEARAEAERERQRKRIDHAIAVGSNLRPPPWLKPKAKPAPEKPAKPPSEPPAPASDAALKRCILAIKKEHTEQGLRPPTERKLHKEVERRLGVELGREVEVARDRVRQVRDAVAPQFRRPVGKPRKTL